jgi:hypothetical protein
VDFVYHYCFHLHSGAHLIPCTTERVLLAAAKSCRTVKLSVLLHMESRSKKRVELYLPVACTVRWSSRRNMLMLTVIIIMFITYCYIYCQYVTSAVLLYRVIEKKEVINRLSQDCHAGKVTKTLSYDCCRLVNFCLFCNLPLLHKISLIAM